MAAEEWYKIEIPVLSYAGLKQSRDFHVLIKKLIHGTAFRISGNWLMYACMNGTPEFWNFETRMGHIIINPKGTVFLKWENSVERFEIYPVSRAGRKLW